MGNYTSEPIPRQTTWSITPYALCLENRILTGPSAP
jgi:hypothetical protein